MAAALARQEDMRAEKQLTAMYDSIEMLAKSDFNKFEQQLQRAAFMYSWPEYILDVNAEIDEDVDPNAHEARHLKNELFKARHLKNLPGGILHSIGTTIQSLLTITQPLLID